MQLTQIDYRYGLFALLFVVLVTCDTRQWKQAEPVETPVIIEHDWTTVQDLGPLEWRETEGETE